MNKLVISGNLVKDVELVYIPGSGVAKIRNTVATRRKTKDKITGEYKSDFIPIVAFGKTAEFIANQFIKGQGIMLECRMQSGSYDNKEGIKVYTLDAIVENVEFLGSKKQGQDTDGSNSFGNMNQDLESRFDGEFKVDDEELEPVKDDTMPF